MKRRKRESDHESEGPLTDPDMPYLSDKEESDDDRQVDLVGDESDEGEVVEQKPTPIVKRSPERDPDEGRSPKRQRLVETTEREPTKSQTKSGDRENRSRSSVKNWEQAITHDPDNETLLEAWNRTGTTGRGREILERIEVVSHALFALLGTRTPSLPKAKKFSSKNEKKEKRGKT